MSQIPIRFKPTDSFYLSSILLILLIINYRVINTWFIVDDTANIFCSSFDTIKLLFDKGTYLYFNQLFFTPLLPISFKLDWLLFKMNPTGYHLHNLLVAFLSCIVFYKFLRFYIPSFFSWLGTIFLSFSLPMSFDIGWINRRHYLWGFFLSLLAIYFFKKWEENKKVVLPRSESRTSLFLSLFSTLLAFLFKEAYAFLPAIVFIISSGSILDRIKKSSAYFVILAIYLVWRIYMLGGMGGYPGSTAEPLFVLFYRLFVIPANLSKNLIGFSYSIYILLIILAFIRFKMALIIAITIIIVNSPFIFFPSGGFPLANKAIFFVSVLAFTLAYIMNVSWNKGKTLFIILFLFLFIPGLIGAASKASEGQSLILRLSGNFEKASKELINHKSEKIMVASNYSYYFSNLEDIYKKMLKTDFPHIKAISDVMILPYLESKDFDRVILANNINLDPEYALGSTVEIFSGGEARRFMSTIVEESKRKTRLPTPAVNFIPSKDRIEIEIKDNRSGKFLRCLYMGSYVGCYPIPKLYTLRYNKVKKFEKIDIIYISEKGELSKPATFKEF